jgi:hypothetical protein
VFKVVAALLERIQADDRDECGDGKYECQLHDPLLLRQTRVEMPRDAY